MDTLGITREPDFCQIRDWCWIINNNINFHLRFLPRKMTKFFKKSKKPYFGAILGTFNLGQKEISRKKELCQVLNIPIIYHLSKNQKKQMSHSWEKCRTDGWTDRQQWFYRTLRSTGSKNPKKDILGLLYPNMGKNKFYQKLISVTIERL